MAIEVTWSARQRKLLNLWADQIADAAMTSLSLMHPDTWTDAKRLHAAMMHCIRNNRCTTHNADFFVFARMFPREFEALGSFNYADISFAYAVDLDAKGKVRVYPGWGGNHKEARSMAFRAAEKGAEVDQ